MVSVVVTIDSIAVNMGPCGMTLQQQSRPGQQGLFRISPLHDQLLY